MVLVLDNLMSAPEMALRIRSIATRFVDRMGAVDTISVVTISGGRSGTSDRKSELKAVISRFQPFVGEPIRSPKGRG